jgi:AcrR family transcriptional regulator
MPEAAASPLELSPRAREVLDAARQLLEEEGYEGLTMRRLGDRIGMRAQSLYEHFSDKRAIENALVAEILWERGEAAFETLAGDPEDPLMAVCDAHRAWAHEHPHLYRLGWGRRLDLDQPAVSKAERHTAAAVLQATGGNPQVGRAIFGFFHGVILLELDERLPPGTEADELWRFGLDSIRARTAE